jgi:hypothetical protein
MTARERIENEGFEDVIIFNNPSYDDAIIGVTTDNRAAYDYDKMIEWLVTNENMDYDEAIDFINWNDSFYYGEGYPLIIYNLTNQN